MNRSGRGSTRRSFPRYGILALCVVAALTARYASTHSADDRPEENAAAQWNPVLIPESWKKPPAGKLASKTGYSWFRCVVHVPQSWADKELMLFVEAVDDARAAYVNGKQVGSTGTFPPRFRSGLGEKGRFQVSAEFVQFGKPNVIAVRVFNNGGRTNFSVAPPVLLAEDQAIRLEGSWEYSFDDHSFERIAEFSGQPPETIQYRQVDQVENVEEYVRLRKGDTPALSPQDAVKRFDLADDLEIEVPLSDPDIGQPLFMNFDERGRLWVMQYLQYPDPAGLKMLSRDKFLRTVYDKVPPPPPNHFRGKDKITIHEDTNGDGVYDKHKTFVDGLNIASSFAKGRGGVWVLNPPYLLFYPDKDNDDIPDADPVVHLQGFGIEDSHSVANSLRWGPDGWLYAAQGSTVTGHIQRPGSKKITHSMGQLIWRYHPEKLIYEIFAEGGGNTFSVEFDAKGRVYSGTNGGDARGYHYVQGCYSQKSFAKHGALSNPYAFGFFPVMKHPSVPRFSHNFIIYEGAALPKQYAGKLFGIEPLQGQIVLSDVQPDGSTFQTNDISRPIKTEDPWFRPVDIKAGPDGAIYIADMYEQRIDHASHFAGRIDKESGRIYRVRAKGESRVGLSDLLQLSNEKLIAQLKSKNKWLRQQVLRLIGDRKDASLVPMLTEVIESNNGEDGDSQFALEALWALNQTSPLTDEQSIAFLEHSDPHVRLWTVRLACDDFEVSAELGQKIKELAQQEKHVEVLAQLASSSKRLPAKGGLPILEQLFDKDFAASDPHIPLLIWWGLEKQCEIDSQSVLALFANKSIWKKPLVKSFMVERLMRRYALSGKRTDLLVCAQLLERAPNAEAISQLMKGFELAFKGRSLTTLPTELVDVMVKVGAGSLELKVRRGDPQAVRQALSQIVDPKTPADKQSELIRLFGSVREQQCIPILLKVLRTTAARQAVEATLAALQSYDNPEIAETVLAVHQKISSTEVRDLAFSLLASRASWSQQLLAAIDAEQVSVDVIAPHVIRKLALHRDGKVAAGVKKHWGSLDGATTESMRQRIDQLSEILAISSGNPSKGKALYMKNCGKCHVLFNEGGHIGPDLTSYQRKDLSRMLLNIVNPSAEIREGFENYLVITDDGRTMTGFLADQDPQVIVLRSVDGQNTTIVRDNIDEMEAISRSVMPDATLKDYDDQQIRDLFAYLRATQPVSY